MKKLYWFYRPEVILWNKIIGANLSQNGRYTISFYANWQYADWIQAGMINIKDQDIADKHYTKEIVSWSWIIDWRRFVYMEYDENTVDLDFANTIINKVGARFDLNLLTSDEAIDFIKTHTDLQEDPDIPWKFLLKEAYTDMDWKEVPAKYLTID